MEFIRDNKNITFDQFAADFREEAKVLCSVKDSQNHIKFIIEDKVLSIASPYSNPISIDLKNKLNYHKTFFYKHSMYKDPLARALGLKSGKQKPHIIDATAGILSDSSLIYSYGCTVSAYERNPYVAALVINALKQCPLEGFHFFPTDYFSRPEKADVIYFDPMYKEKNDKTTPKKEMQLFRDLIGPDEDAYAFALNLKDQTKRLVIKRSSKAQSLIEKPTHSIIGKSTTYDVYLQA